MPKENCIEPGEQSGETDSGKIHENLLLVRLQLVPGLTMLKQMNDEVSQFQHHLRGLSDPNFQCYMGK